MSMNERFRIETILKIVLPNLADTILLQRAANYDAVVKDAKTIQVSLATGPVQTVYTIDFTGLTNVNFLQFRARYRDADTANNIAQFDPAKVEVNINGLGYLPAQHAGILEDCPITSLLVRVPTTETVARVILFQYFIGGAG